MIAKRITSKAAKPRMARLVRYVVAAEGGIDPRSWERTADYVLCSKVNNKGEKVGGVRVTNCNTDDPAAATTLIEVTQAANTRSKTDKTYHLVFSFPPGEQPSLEVLHKIEDELVASIGYADHQRISAVHIDTDHLHVHVAINKVRKIGNNFNNISPKWDKFGLMRTCERLEIEHGLIRTNHGLTGEKTKAERLKERQAQAEIHSGIETLTGRVTRDVAPRLKEAKSWKEAHSILAEHGLEIKQRGAGLVIGNRNLWVKASQCDRSLSFKAMTDKLGPFEKYTVKPKTTYEPSPKQKHPSSFALYKQYRVEISANRDAKEQALSDLAREHKDRNAKAKRWASIKRAAIRASTKGMSRSAALAMVRLQYRQLLDKNYREMVETRKKVYSSHHSGSWPEWLTRQAKSGNEQALEVLREGKGAFMSGDTLSGEDGKHSIAKENGPTVDIHGRVIYETKDGGKVIDHTNQIQAVKTTSESVAFAVDLAAKRFAGKPLKVNGEEEFRKNVAHFAGIYRVNVRFADKELERIRQQLAASGKTINKGIDL